MSAERETLIARIAKLLNMSEGARAVGNQHEAEAFAAKVQELLIKHKLEMSEIELKQAAEDDPVEEDSFNPQEHGIRPRRSRMRWQEDLATAVAKAYFCRVVVFRDSNRLRFIGRRTDRQVTLYVYTVLARTAEKLVKQEYRRYKRAMGGAGLHTRGFNTAFLLGFTAGVTKKLEEERRAMEAAMQAAGQSTALVRLSDAHQAVSNYVRAKAYGSAQAPRPKRSADNSAAYARGVDAGLKSELPKRGLNDTPSGPQSLPR